jgi:hypothetical protein
VVKLLDTSPEESTVCLLVFQKLNSLIHPVFSLSFFIISIFFMNKRFKNNFEKEWD